MMRRTRHRAALRIGAACASLLAFGLGLLGAGGAWADSEGKWIGGGDPSSDAYSCLSGRVDAAAASRAEIERVLTGGELYGEFNTASEDFDIPLGMLAKVEFALTGGGADKVELYRRDAETDKSVWINFGTSGYKAVGRSENGSRIYAFEHVNHAGGHARNGRTPYRAHLVAGIGRPSDKAVYFEARLATRELGDAGTGSDAGELIFAPPVNQGFFQGHLFQSDRTDDYVLRYVRPGTRVRVEIETIKARPGDPDARSRIDVHVFRRGCDPSKPADERLFATPKSPIAQASLNEVAQGGFRAEHPGHYVIRVEPNAWGDFAYMLKVDVEELGSDRVEIYAEDEHHVPVAKFHVDQKIRARLAYDHDPGFETATATLSSTDTGASITAALARQAGGDEFVSEPILLMQVSDGGGSTAPASDGDMLLTQTGDMIRIESGDGAAKEFYVDARSDLALEDAQGDGFALANRGRTTSRSPMLKIDGFASHPVCQDFAWQCAPRLNLVSDAGCEDGEACSDDATPCAVLDDGSASCAVPGAIAPGETRRYTLAVRANRLQCDSVSAAFDTSSIADENRTARVSIVSETPDDDPENDTVSVSSPVRHANAPDNTRIVARQLALARAAAEGRPLFEYIRLGDSLLIPTERLAVNEAFFLDVEFDEPPDCADVTLELYGETGSDDDWRTVSLQPLDGSDRIFRTAALLPVDAVAEDIPSPPEPIAVYLNDAAQGKLIARGAGREVVFDVAGPARPDRATLQVVLSDWRNQPMATEFDVFDYDLDDSGVLTPKTITALTGERVEVDPGPVAVQGDIKTYFFGSDRHDVEAGEQKTYFFGGREELGLVEIFAPSVSGGFAQEDIRVIRDNTRVIKLQTGVPAQLRKGSYEVWLDFDEPYQDEIEVIAGKRQRFFLDPPYGQLYVSTAKPHRYDVTVTERGDAALLSDGHVEGKSNAPIDLPAGEYRVTVARGPVQSVHDVTIETGERAEISLQPEDEGRVRLVTPDQTTLAGFELGLIAPDETKVFGSFERLDVLRDPFPLAAGEYQFELLYDPLLNSRSHPLARVGASEPEVIRKVTVTAGETVTFRLPQLFPVTLHNKTEKSLEGSISQGDKEVFRWRGFDPDIPSATIYLPFGDYVVSYRRDADAQTKTKTAPVGAGADPNITLD